MTGGLARLVWVTVGTARPGDVMKYHHRRDCYRREGSVRIPTAEQAAIVAGLQECCACAAPAYPPRGHAFARRGVQP